MSNDDQSATTPTTAPGLKPFSSVSSAATWESGLIVGSGRVGGLLFGAPGALTLSLSHERFFLPANPTPNAPDLAGALADIQHAILEGDGELAADLMVDAAKLQGFDKLIWTNPLAICATLTIRSAATSDEPSLRRIDLEHGEVGVEWDDPEAGSVTVRILAPRGTETVALALEAERATTFELELAISREAAEMAPTGAGDYSAMVRSDAHPGAVGVLRAMGTRDSEIAATTSVTGAGQWQPGGRDDSLVSSVAVPAGGRVVLSVDVSVAPSTDWSAEPALAPTDWDALRSLQVQSHGELVRRSVLDLSGGSADTTEELWRRARAGDLAARRGVVEAAYLSGRANAISATGELPPTLQGVWQGTWSPAWSADYTMNGNVQNGGIASLIPTGTPELARSLLRLVLPYLQDYRDNARNIFGVDGMLLPARMSDHGRANHFGRAYPHIFWVGCGGWVLRFAADLVSTTGDRSVVDDELWELVRGVLEFAENATVVDDGVRRLIPGYSPENAPVAGGSPLIADPTMDVAILRDAARSARVLAAAIGDDTLDARWERVVADLPPYRVAEDGTLAEWIDPAWPENIAHRHVSQLYPLWYEPDAAFVGDDPRAQELRDAAATTIAAKIAWRAEDATAPPGRMEMAFGLVQLGLAAAALGDADAALTCVEWLAVEHWTPALTTTHDAGRIFNLDPSGGLPAVVASMLFSSTLDSATLLPAVPDQWRSAGSITGLTGRGGIVVERLEWDEAGARVVLRRRPEVSWLKPDLALHLRVGSGFTFAGGSSELAIEVGAEPVELRLDAHHA
jgi:hypothetical protein